MSLGAQEAIGFGSLVVTSVVLFAGSAAAVLFGWKPIRSLIARQQQQYDHVLRGRLLLDVSPRSATILTGVAMLAAAGLGYWLSGSLFGGLVALGASLALPSLLLRYLARRRLKKLEDQLVSGIQTLASGVRAGLNLVQGMQLVARDGPIPLRQEFRHLLREYDYGVSLEEAMDKASNRIGSGDFRLLFAALQMHRQRGGNLGETLDRIAGSIREIQRLENRVRALTAQGRATARWLGAMPLIVLLILNFLVDDTTLGMMFADSLGKVIILMILVLNVVSYLWIKRIVSLDV